MSRRIQTCVGVLIPAVFTITCNTDVETSIEESARTSPLDTNSVDRCPDDPNKFSPGLCGCGIADGDTDGDFTQDCRDGCPTDPFKTSPGECGCGEPETCNALRLLAPSIDGIIVLDDLTVWDANGYTTITDAVRWLVGAPVKETDGRGDAQFVLQNLETREAVGVDFLGVGLMYSIAGFQEQQFGARLVTLDDGSIWGIFFADENQSQGWQVGDIIVVYDNGFFFEAILLRTGRVLGLDSTPSIR